MKPIKAHFRRRMGLIQPISGRPRAKTPFLHRRRRRRRRPERLFAMASLAPRLLLRRRPLHSAAAAASLLHPRLALPVASLSVSHTPRGVRSHSLGLVSLEFSGSWMRLCGAGSSPRPPGASPLFEPPRVVSERWMDGAGCWFRQPVRHGSTAVTLDTDGGFARFSVGGDADTKQGAGRKGQPPAKATKKKMSRKAKVNQLKWYRLKAKKKMKSPNPEVRIRYKLEKVYNISVLLICLVSICCLNVSDCGEMLHC